MTQVSLMGTRRNIRRGGGEPDDSPHKNKKARIVQKKVAKMPPIGEKTPPKKKNVAIGPPYRKKIAKRPPYNIQYNTIQYNTIQYNTIQYNTNNNSKQFFSDSKGGGASAYSCTPSPPLRAPMVSLACSYRVN